MMVPDKLPTVLIALEDLDLAYLVKGSLASVAWGQPRATYDLDIVIDLRADDVDRLLAQFLEPEWYADKAMALEAIRTLGEFNLIHSNTGTKVDVWIKDQGGFDDSRFERRRRETVAGVSCWVQSPEDTILAKLRGASMSPSEKQIQDVTGIIKVQGDALDLSYLRRWAKNLNIEQSLTAVLQDAET